MKELFIIFILLFSINIHSQEEEETYDLSYDTEYSGESDPYVEIYYDDTGFESYGQGTGSNNANPNNNGNGTDGNEGNGKGNNPPDPEDPTASTNNNLIKIIISLLISILIYFKLK
jgi:hypothetical protein